MQAAINGHTDVLELLLSSGISIDAVNMASWQFLVFLFHLFFSSLLFILAMSVKGVSVLIFVVLLSHFNFGPRPVTRR